MTGSELGPARNPREFPIPCAKLGRELALRVGEYVSPICAAVLQETPGIHDWHWPDRFDADAREGEKTIICIPSPILVHRIHRAAGKVSSLSNGEIYNVRQQHRAAWSRSNCDVHGGCDGDRRQRHLGAAQYRLLAQPSSPCAPFPPYIPGINTWWSNLSPPSAADSATFDVANTYSVIVNGNPPSIRDLTVSAGDVTLVNGGAVESLSLSLFSGPQSVSVTGDGTTLSFGNGPGTAVNLAAPYSISLQSGGSDLQAATLNVRDGSEVEAGNVVIGTAGHSGDLEVDGSGTLVKTTTDATSNDWGLAGGIANVRFTARRGRQLSLETLGWRTTMCREPTLP